MLYLDYEEATGGGYFVRLVRILSDGCTPHMLCGWFRVFDKAGLNRTAKREDATLRYVGWMPQ